MQILIGGEDSQIANNSLTSSVLIDVKRPAREGPAFLIRRCDQRRHPT